MNSRQQQQMAGRQQQLQQRGGAPIYPRGPAGFAPDGPSQTKRFKVEGPAESGAGPRPTLPAFYLTQQQLQMLQHLQNNQNSLNPQQQHVLQQLQHHYRLMQQHQQQIRLQQQQQQQQLVRPNQPFPARVAAPFNAGSPSPVLPQQQGNFPRSVTPQPANASQQLPYPNMPCSPALSSPSGVSVSDQELQVGCQHSEP